MEAEKNQTPVDGDLPLAQEAEDAVMDSAPPTEPETEEKREESEPAVDRGLTGEEKIEDQPVSEPVAEESAPNEETAAEGAPSDSISSEGSSDEEAPQDAEDTPREAEGAPQEFEDAPKEAEEGAELFESREESVEQPGDAKEEEPLEEQKVESPKEEEVDNESAKEEDNGPQDDVKEPSAEAPTAQEPSIAEPSAELPTEGIQKEEADEDGDVEMKDVEPSPEESSVEPSVEPSSVVPSAGPGSVEPSAGPSSVEPSAEPSILGELEADDLAKEASEEETAPKEETMEPQALGLTAVAPEVTSEENNDMDLSMEDGGAEKRPLADLEEPQLQKRQKSTSEEEIVKAQQTHAIVIPSYAAWFDIEKINAIEKKSLPEFFSKRNRSKTPQIYKRYRDFIVNTYRLNPFEYLTITACRRNLSGDVCAIMRVHSFLEKWGLINYQADVESRPRNVAPPYTGHWKPTLDTPRGLFPFQLYEPLVDPLMGPKEGRQLTDATNGTAAHKTEHYEPPQAKKSEGGPAEINKRANWTNKELLRLLEAIEKTPNNWDAIHSHVATKSKSECVLQFLSLAIEDRYLDKDGNLGPLKYGLNGVPFSHPDSPVMSVVSFLAGLVDPKVVAAAAGKSIEQIKELHRKQIEELEKDQEKKPSPEGESTTTNGNEDKEAEPKKENEDDTGIGLQDSSSMAFGSIAARSHVLATNNERVMYSQFMKLMSQQSKKINLKLDRFAEIERSLENERRRLEKEREEIFLSRLALQKRLDSVNSLLTQAVAKASQGDITAHQPQIQSLVGEADRLLKDSTRLTLAGADEIAARQDAAVAEEDAAKDDNTNTSSISVKPVSVDMPETFKFWSA
ncbi:SWI/SNF complex subunit Swi3p [Trichomonascus vanleenenianus]|uniref:Swi3p n=1 Tax=Trichomonascus vanleenenianus TaxID=2268995 RepID=UPI003ECB3AAD